jgi:hypothetical protein
MSLCAASNVGMAACRAPQAVRVTFTAPDGRTSRPANLCRGCAHRAAVLAGATDAVASVTFDNLPALRRGEGYGITYH